MALLKETASSRVMPLFRGSLHPRTVDLGVIKAQPFTVSGDGSDAPRPLQSSPWGHLRSLLGLHYSSVSASALSFFLHLLCLSAQAAVTAYHRMGGLNNRNLLSHSPGGWKYKMKFLAGMVSGEACLHGL